MKIHHTKTQEPKKVILKTVINNLSIGFVTLLALTSCSGQNNPKTNNNTDQNTHQTQAQAFGVNGNLVSELGKDIQNIFQDKDGMYWTNGVYRFDGKSLLQFTEKDGLCGNTVIDIQEDINGSLWLNTSKGLCKFDGEKFSNYTDTLKNVSKEDLTYKQTDLFFCYDGIVYKYDGISFSKFIIYPSTYKPSSIDLDRPYGVYCTLKDRAGNLWFGTDQKGVCRFDGKKFTYFTDHGLDNGAVRIIFQDKKGNIWFGNNGFGLFQFDGKNVTNFTSQNDLSNPDFIQKKTTTKNKANLARVWTINEDNEDNLWIGTIDNGAWRYKENSLINFSTKDGLTNNKISKIFKDKQGILWFITEDEGICKWNGKSFEKFQIK